MMHVIEHADARAAHFVLTDAPHVPYAATCLGGCALDRATLPPP
jgi:hypothetical protein